MSCWCGTVRLLNLLLALFEDDAQGLDELIDDLESWVAGSRERLRLYAEAVLARSEDPARVQVRADMWTAMPTEDEIRSAFAASMQFRRMRLRSRIEEAVASGELVDIPANAFASILLASVTACSSWQPRSRRHPLGEYQQSARRAARGDQPVTRWATRGYPFESIVGRPSGPPADPREHRQVDPRDFCPARRQDDHHPDVPQPNPTNRRRNAHLRSGRVSGGTHIPPRSGAPNRVAGHSPPGSCQGATTWSSSDCREVATRVCRS